MACSNGQIYNSVGGDLLDVSYMQTIRTFVFKVSKLGPQMHRWAHVNLHKVHIGSYDDELNQSACKKKIN